MTIRTCSLSAVTLFLVCLGAGLSPNALGAQDYMGDFMFHPPKVTLSFNLGYGVPSAGSDLFEEVTDIFTVGKGDFHAPVIGGGLSFFLNDRMDLALEFSFARSSTWSEYVDWVDDQDLPIEQETKFTQVPFTLSFKYFLMDRGRSIGNLSWISTNWAPYLGVGGGWMYYEFEQAGDFVDFVDYSIFRGSVASQGFGLMGHIFGGLQWSFSPQFLLSAEARYSRASADLDRPDFGGYDPIDLSGLQTTIGFGIRF